MPTTTGEPDWDGFGELMEHAHAYVKDAGHSWCEGSRFESEYLPDEFWGYYETVTDRLVPESHRGSFFSCSC